MLEKLNDLFYGWRMVAASAALRVLGAGLHSYGFPVFFLPLSQDLNLSRTATSFAFSLASLFYGVIIKPWEKTRAPRVA